MGYNSVAENIFIRLAVVGSKVYEISRNSEGIRT